MKPSCYIDGRWKTGGRTHNVINPATETPVEVIRFGTKADAADAVSAAAAAFDAWRRRTVYERAGYLKQTAGAIRERLEDLAVLLTQEVGKPLAESRGEIGAAADQFEWYAEEVKRPAGDVIPARMDHKRHASFRRPIGPVAAIGPWNFPLLLISRKMAPALAVGCTVVCRPASQAPLTLMAVFALLDEIGFPPGVVNLVCAPPADCAGVFVNDPRIRKISFTGSLEVGRKLYTAAAARMKPVSLELGGHSPFIVMPDADPVSAATIAVQAKFRNMGQVCISPSRFLVPNDMKTAFETAAVALAERLQLGDGLAPFVEVGPLFDADRVRETQSLVDDIAAKGGRILCGGRQPSEDAFPRGYFYLPTVATDITEQMAIMNKEPFAPVLPVIGYDTVDAAVEQANNTPYGLAAYVITDRLSDALSMLDHLEAGIIGINDPAPATAQCPFGGMKHSGIGREGGREGLAAYYETQYVSIGFGSS